MELRIKKEDLESFKLQLGVVTTSAFLQILEKLRDVLKTRNEVVLDVHREGHGVKVAILSETFIRGGKVYVNHGDFTFGIAPRIDVRV